MTRVALTESIDIESRYVTAVTRTRHTMYGDNKREPIKIFYNINVYMCGDKTPHSYSVGVLPDETLQDLVSKAEAERQRVVELVWPNSMKEEAPPPSVDLDTYTT